MNSRAARTLSLTLALTLSLLATTAEAQEYLVVEDDGSLAASAFRTSDEVVDAVNTILDGYRASGSAIPDVLSVWSTFPMGSSTLGTLFVPIGNDVRGIGLERAYRGDGTFGSSLPPLRAVLLHNSMNDLPARAARHDAPLEGYAEYLFLLELSHVWGPEILAPLTPDDALIGFDFHWSFYLDAGGGPAGGNVWLDNHDGTFTTGAQSPSTVRFSMLDLYLLGLATPDEVPPFAVLTEVTAPAGVRDPINGRPELSQATFPWFGATPVTVEATRRELSIDDVIAANGPRSPAAGESPTTLDVGIVLLVGQDLTPEERTEAHATFAPIAASLAPAFHRATRERGTLDIVTSTTPSDPDAGASDASAPDAGVLADAAPLPTMQAASCAVSPLRSTSSVLVAMLAAAASIRATRRHRRAR